MSRIDDEGNLGVGDQGLIHAFDLSSKPNLLKRKLTNLWIERFSKSALVEASDWEEWTIQPGLYLSLEYLRKTGQIPDVGVFNKDGTLKKDSNPNDLDLIFGAEGLLSGKNVMVFGGPEGEVFEAMGAHAVGFDPVFRSAFRKGYGIELKTNIYDRAIEGLEELSKVALHGWADLTYSNNIFDPGSGMVHGEETRRGDYANRLGIVLAMTKPGGLSIHSGNGLVAAIHPEHDRGFLPNESFGFGFRRYSDLAKTINRDVVIGDIQARVLGIILPRLEAGIGNSDTVYVLQRKAA